MSEKSKLSSKDRKLINKTFWRSWALFGSFNMVKMQGYGYSYAMQPAIKKYYKNDKDIKKALVRSSTFFNCTYETAPFIMGLNIAMEKENSENKDFDESSINAVKASLMGPLSGIGDSIFWGTLWLIAAGIGIPLAMIGSILGPILFLLIYHIPSIIVRYKLLEIGYTSGEKFLKTAYKSGALETIAKCATTVGLIMTAQSVTITTPLKIALKQSSPLVIQDILNSIMPGLLPLTITLLAFYLLRKKIKVTYLLFGIIIVGILGALIGIF
jgi:mannose/fructose/N-acetylgalactosamine-specific phosphotransferase system component IID